MPRDLPSDHLKADAPLPRKVTSLEIIMSTTSETNRSRITNPSAPTPTQAARAMYMPASRFGPQVNPSTDRLMRIALVGIGVLMMLWATSYFGGCASGNGKYTTERKNAAKDRIDGLKSATEYQMGLQSFMAGNLEKAEKHTDRALTLSDDVARNWVLKGRIKLEQSDLQPASVAFQKAEQLDPTNVEAVYFQGILAERVMEREEALTFYQRAAELDKQNPQYSLAAAEVLIDLGRTSEAETYLTSRQEAFRHTAGIQQTLGHIAMLKSDYAAAERYFGEARLLAPSETDVLEDLARAQFLNSNWAEAESSFKRLLKAETTKDRHDLAFMQAKCLMNLDRNAEARDALVELSKKDSGSNDVETWIALGQAAYTLRDTARLRMSFARTIAIAPARHEGYVLKGLHLQRMGDLEGAQREFRKAVERTASAENYMLLGLAQHRAGNDSAAQSSFVKAREVDPTNQLAQALATNPQAASQLAGVQE
jgi:Flp pilus assembly protein TadD